MLSQVSYNKYHGLKRDHSNIAAINTIRPTTKKYSILFV